MQYTICIQIYFCHYNIIPVMVYTDFIIIKFVRIFYYSKISCNFLL